MLFSPRRLPLLAGAMLLTLAAPAAAHPGHVIGGWTAGFSHPLLGWDHVVVMVTAGAWAAQHVGHARWVIPATFVAVMGIGGAAGAFGITLPGAEAMILISAITLAGLVLARQRLPLGWGMALAGLFAFFHGFAHLQDLRSAHGQELPDPSALVPFGVGFMAATALLHGLGYAAGRVAAAAAAHRHIKHV